MSRELVVIPGDDIGREVVPLAARCLRAMLPDLRLVDGEAGWEAAWRAGQAVDEATVEAIRRAGSALLGPERPFAEPGASATEGLTAALDLFAALYPLRDVARGIDLVLLAEWLPATLATDEPQTFSPAHAWSATRVGNLGGWLAARGRRRVALAHDSEEPFVHAVVAGIEEHAPVERMDALFLANQFPMVARDYDLIVVSARTGRLVVPHAARHLAAPTSLARLLIGPGVAIASPLHGPLREQVGWGFANPLGALHAAAALLRYGWDDAEAARRLEGAIARATARRRPPDLGGLHTMYEVVGAVMQELER